MYCVTSITTLKLDGGLGDKLDGGMKGSLGEKREGGMKGSLGDNVWYERTSFVRIRKYESAFKKS